ncbi:hypothetical protein HDU76_011828, partial [Blyttiomyces sp. JEL0837]
DVSRESEIVISLFQRGSNNGDVLVGSARYRPSFNDQKTDDDWIRLAGPNATDTGPSISGGRVPTPIPLGEIRLQLTYKRQSPTKKSLTMDDFELLKVIGKGSFGKVMQVRKKDTGRIYAMKIIKKAHIVERDEVSHTLAERTVLAKIIHPFIVPIKFSFQSPEKLYLVLAFINGGELFHHLQQEGRFNEDRARFYTAELLCALECLHGFNIVDR